MPDHRMRHGHKALKLGALSYGKAFSCGLYPYDLGDAKIGVERIHQNEKCTILVIDEAHLIDPQVLTDLRVLVSSLDQPLSLKILLCGQESLGQILKRSSHADLVHRITLRFSLQSLSKDQTSAYIDSRITMAGGSAKIFDPETKHLIHDYTGGVPRQINNVATACLINAASRNQKMITEALVNETMMEFHLP